jgi:hypothetical protein
MADDVNEALLEELQSRLMREIKERIFACPHGPELCIAAIRACCFNAACCAAKLLDIKDLNAPLANYVANAMIKSLDDAIENWRVRN